VSYDAKRGERSFAIFGAGSGQRAQVVRRGARIAGYQISSIAQGAVVLTSRGQSCSVRLRGASADSEPRVIAAAAVRSELRARKAAFSSAVRALGNQVIAQRN
jgi:hypothetical protein